MNYKHSLKLQEANMEDSEIKRKVRLLLNDYRFGGYKFLLDFGLPYKFIYTMLHMDSYHHIRFNNNDYLVYRLVKEGNNEQTIVGMELFYIRDALCYFENSAEDLGFESIDDAYNKLHEVKVFLELIR